MNPASASTFLFVPGDRPDRFARAAASGADVVVLDLEDGVPPAARTVAREHVEAWLRSGRQAVVRLNACGSDDHARDVRALRGAATQVMLARTESAADADATADELGGGVRVTALVETSRGVAAAAQIGSSDVVVRLAFGNVDLAAELGVAADDRQALLTARSSVVLGSAVAGLPGPVDGVTTRLHDPEVLESDTAYAVSLGFRGKLLVHPRQLAAARAGLRPTPEQVTWARAVLAEASEGQARAVDGVMVDRPVEERAREILRRFTPPPAPRGSAGRAVRPGWS